MVAFTVRLPDDIAAVLQQEAARRATTPADILRTAVTAHLHAVKNPPPPPHSAKAPPAAPTVNAAPQADRYRRLVYEVVKTRTLILRALDRHVGHEAADEYLDLAEGDAETYVKEQLGG